MKRKTNPKRPAKPAQVQVQQKVAPDKTRLTSEHCSKLWNPRPMHGSAICPTFYHSLHYWSSKLA